MMDEGNISIGEAAVADCLLDSESLGRLLGMSRASIRVALCRGRFPLKPIRIGRRLRWRASVIRNWLDSQSADAAGGR